MIGGNFVRNSIDIGVSIAILAGIACGQPADNVSESTSQDPPVAGATLDQQIKQFYPPQSEIPITFSSTELEESTTLRTQQGIVQILPNGLLQYYDALAARGFPQ
ncbi:MAG: hypothetical protein QGI38_02165 [Candidatus Woesearchaeota archaeon]|nr:hypothetical protein [Candidatus Woesearchaeota archaeon]